MIMNFMFVLLHNCKNVIGDIQLSPLHFLRNSRYGTGCSNKNVHYFSAYEHRNIIFVVSTPHKYGGWLRYSVEHPLYSRDYIVNGKLIMSILEMEDFRLKMGDAWYQMEYGRWKNVDCRWYIHDVRLKTGGILL